MLRDTTEVFLERPSKTETQPDPADIGAILTLKHKHGFFPVLFQVMPDGGKKPINKWREGAEPPTDEQIRQHEGPIGFRHEDGKPIIIDIDFHGDMEPRFPHEIIDPLKHDEADYFIDISLNGGIHACLPYSEIEHPTKSGSPSFFYRGYHGELRFNRCSTIVTDWVGFLAWYEQASKPPMPDFYAALLRHRVPKPSRYHNPLLPDLWKALVLQEGNKAIGALIKKWRREGYTEDVIQITLKKTKRRYRALLRAALEWIDAHWQNNVWASMRGFGREHLAIMLLLGEKEALSYASRIALAKALKCCERTISRWRTQWLDLGIIIPQGYNIISTDPSGWQNRIPIFALPRFQQTVSLKFLSLTLLGKRRYRTETFILDVGARAPPNQLPLVPAASSDFTPAHDFQEAS